MNFSLEQIQNVKKLRIEFVEKLQMFAYAINYAKEMYSINENNDSWINDVLEITKEFKIEDHLLGRQNILMLQEKGEEETFKHIKGVLKESK